MRFAYGGIRGVGRGSRVPGGGALTPPQPGPGWGLTCPGWGALTRQNVASPPGASRVRPQGCPRGGVPGATISPTSTMSSLRGRYQSRIIGANSMHTTDVHTYLPYQRSVARRLLPPGTGKPVVSCTLYAPPRLLYAIHAVPKQISHSTPSVHAHKILTLIPRNAHSTTAHLTSRPPRRPGASGGQRTLFDFLVVRLLQSLEDLRRLSASIGRHPREPIRVEAERRPMEGPLEPRRGSTALRGCGLWYPNACKRHRTQRRPGERHSSAVKKDGEVEADPTCVWWGLRVCMAVG